MGTFKAEVAICFLDRTWTATSVVVEGLSKEEAEKAAEDEVLADFSAHRTKAISFVKAIYIEPKEEN